MEREEILLLVVQGVGGYGMDVQPLLELLYFFLMTWVARDLGLEGFEVWGPSLDRIWGLRMNSLGVLLLIDLPPKVPLNLNFSL